MTDPKVTVVVPAYNNETVIRECLDSIVGQTLKDIEIIIVDDESTDKTFDIAKEYEASDSRVKAFRQKHSNAGEARNYGLSMAKGKYLVFWDSDDTFEQSALEKLYDKTSSTDADVCICDADKRDTITGRIYKKNVFLSKELIPQKEVFNRTDFTEKFLILTTNHPWNKMYRRDFILENQLQFQSVPKANDVYFVMMALSLANRITILNERLIHYRSNYSGSITRTGTTSPMHVFSAYECVKEELSKRGIYDELANDIINKAFSSYSHVLNMQCEIENSKYFDEMYEYIKGDALTKLDYIDGKTIWYDESKKELYDRIRNGSREDYLFYYIRELVGRNDRVNKKLSAANDKISAYEKTLFYKVWRKLK